MIRTALLFLVALMTVSLNAEIINCTVEKLELIDSLGKVKEVPILAYKWEDLNSRKHPVQQFKKIVIAGLGTNHVTAQGDDYFLSVSEQQLYPMNKTDLSGSDGNEWYYFGESQGVLIIEIIRSKKKIKIYHLGIAPATYVGTYE